jgi:hydrogenase-4 membrane subunit HyfE
VTYPPYHSASPTSFSFPIGGAVIIAIVLVIIFYLIYRITMTPTPFKTMKAMYVYIAALIGLILVSIGLYSIIEYILGILLTNTPFNTIMLVTPLAQLITGLFIMIPHWAIGHHFHTIEHKKKK